MQVSGPLRYEGVDSGGNHRHGSLFSPDLPHFVAEHYSRDWQSLDVWQGARKVAEIRRMACWSSWWAERGNGDLAGMAKITLEDAPLD